MLYLNKFRRKPAIFKFLLLSILVFFVSNFLERTYHWAFHGKFISTPFTGIQLATNAFYASKDNDYQLFNDIDDQRIVKTILDFSFFNKNKSKETKIIIKIIIKTKRY